VLETVERLKGLKAYNNFNMTLSTTISKKNYKEIVELINKIKELGEFHGLQFIRDSDEHTYNIDKNLVSDFSCVDDIVLLKDMEEMQAKLKELVQANDSGLLMEVTKLFNENVITIIKTKKRVVNCLAGKVDGVVLTNGDVSMCEFTKPFANLRDYDYDFYKLWTSEKANEVRGKLKSCACIHPCNLVNSMRYDLKSIKKVFNV